MKIFMITFSHELNRAEPYIFLRFPHLETRSSTQLNTTRVEENGKFEKEFFFFPNNPSLPQHLPIVFYFSFPVSWLIFFAWYKIKYLQKYGINHIEYKGKVGCDHSSMENCRFHKIVLYDASAFSIVSLLDDFVSHCAIWRIQHKNRRTNTLTNFWTMKDSFHPLASL